MKRIYTTLFVAIMAIGLLMTGCGAPPDITGTWVSNCVPNAATPGTYDQYTSSFDGTERLAYITSYLTPDCSGDPGWEYASAADYTIGDETTVTGLHGTEGWEIDYTWTAATLTVLDAAYLGGFESIVCGLTGWEVDVPMNMLDVDCPDFPNPNPGDGQESLEVFAIASDGAAMYHGNLAVPDSGVREIELSDLVWEQ